jgi:DNA-binding LytR/AlgR family response regulator
MTTTALIADDEPHLLKHLAALLGQAWPELQLLEPARNGLEAAARIAAENPDIAFLDIQMPGLSGLEVAQGIEGDTRVVFVTAFDEYAVPAFEAAAVDYLLKPLKLERLQRTVERLKSSSDDQMPMAIAKLAPAKPAQPLRWIRASSGELTHQVDVQDIVYFHADEKYTVLRLKDSEHLIRTPIQELASQLDPEQFWQVHRSTIVNLAHLAGTRRDEASRLFLRFKGLTTELPVSRAYVPLFKAM